MNPTEGNNNGSFGFLKIFRGNKNGASQGAAISPSSATPQPIINTNLPPASQMNADIKQVGIEQDLSNATSQDSTHSAIAESSSGYPSSSQMNADIKNLGQQNDIRQEKALNQQVASDIKPVAANTLPWNYAMDTLHTNISSPSVLNKITHNSAGIQFNGNGLSDGKGAIDSVTIDGHTYTDLGHINGAIKFVLDDKSSSVDASTSHVQSISPSHTLSNGTVAGSSSTTSPSSTLSNGTVAGSSFPPSSTYAVPSTQTTASSNLIVGTGEAAITAKDQAQSGWAEKPVLNPVSPINEANSKTQASTDNQNIHYRPFER